ncbi:MAG TPA: undecaprenyldiphospho-muramoylpentapeptide beta-N-acetylglucosaminyltransferase [Rhizomicrobium sp.]|jgi:UDP-N-acetylglucosamine--N-acetylmuramyl-(pentapeptide) pyrophosphoryl-undecaprenol N-acetylglucosamine transferase|nr:undecaprenyldiphospho-muramoylpentapeptide beta-N-acetylglucosaminyltransferase [Rhizomicrobium sp.]
MTTIVLSAGGTGGHLFPAQALASELMHRGDSIVVMTDSRGRNYGAAFPGARIETVPSGSPSEGSFIARLLFPFEVLAGVIAAFGKLLHIKPAAVVGFGGYPSLPVMIAALLGGYPTAIHEQNAVPGRVNRLVASRVKAIAASFPFARFAPANSSVTLTGNPVRPEAAALAGSPYPLLDANNPIKLLVFGGSQGARALSDIVPAAVALLPLPIKSRLEIVQQCRPEDIEFVRVAYAVSGVKVELASFFQDLPARIAASHLIISRSGASTVGELAAIGRPAILIPYPFATDDHQTANAGVLADAGAGWRIQQRDLTPAKLASLLEEAFGDPQGLAKRAAIARSLGKPDAAKALADLVERIGAKEAA